MFKNGKPVKIITYIMLLAMILSPFTCIISATTVYAGDAGSIYTNRPNIAGGNGFTIALEPDGRVFGWGKNQFGQLGGGTITNPIPNFSEVIAVSAGIDHAVALKNDGTVWAWGKNNNNQIGDGTTTNRTSPVQVSGLSQVEKIATWADHSLALKRSGCHAEKIYQPVKRVVVQ